MCSAQGVLKDEVFKITEIKTHAAMIRDEMSDRIVEVAQSIVTSAGTGALTVREILKQLNITNRVFYNRFHNIGEVLAIVYRNTVLKVRESISANVEGKSRDEFFDYVNEILTSLLTISYDTKKRFNQYVFDNDSISQSNFEWWFREIKKLIEYAKAQGFIRDVDTDAMSYSIWCFCRGYNADAVGRNIPRETAIENFKYSFSILLDGMKK